MIYADHAATTPLSPAAYAAITKDDDTLYFISENNAASGKLYLGNKRMKENRMTLTEYSINKNEIEQVINGIESK